MAPPALRGPVLQRPARRSDGLPHHSFLQFSIDDKAEPGVMFWPASQEDVMLKWALIFAGIAIVAGLFGFTGIAAGAAGIA